MDTNQKQRLASTLANLQVHMSLGSFTKVPLTWRDENFTPDYARFYFIIEGEGMLKIRSKTYQPKPGQLYLLPSGVTQSYMTTSANTFLKYWCHFTATVGDLNLFQLIETPVCIDVDHPARLAKRFDRLLAAYGSGEPAAVVRTKALLLEIVAYYLEHCGDRLKYAASAPTEKIDIVLRHIDAHLAEGITVEQLAKLIHLHPNYFIHYFKKTLGLSPIQYINKQRIEKAKRLLLTTDSTVSEVAVEVGLQLYYFSRLFKQQTGLSPTVFRSMLETRAEG